MKNGKTKSKTANISFSEAASLNFISMYIEDLVDSEYLKLIENISPAVLKLAKQL